MSDDKQAVADATDTGTQQSSVDSDGAQDDLDSLLAEYDESVQDKRESSTDSQGESQDDDEVKQWAKARMEEEQREKTQKDIQTAVDTMKSTLPEDLPVDVPNELLEGYLYRIADKDKRVLNAFMNRHEEPDKWNRVLKAAANEFSGLFAVDQQATSDRNAVSAAVRSASKAPATEDGPSEKDISSMSDSEFNQLKEKMLSG